ncbi:MAG TPA: SUMF1/EgtB/PvdO family nonheme iron enzyme [Micropepsaceae bacterium]|nr:SUMF1/EgtB/PvdO family nonheme iron enzyme [Micropepsaceae bacterium]
MTSLRTDAIVLIENRAPHAELAAEMGPPIAYAEFHLSWKNSWRTSRNHDAVWVAVKLTGIDANGEKAARHAAIAGDPVVVPLDAATRSAGITTSVAPDRTGFFVEPGRRYRGDITLSLRVPVDPAATEGLARETIRADVLAIEMVFIPEGPFLAGAAAEEELVYGAFYRSGPDGRFAGAFPIESEDEIPVGPFDGALNYRILAKLSHMGDGNGPVPAAYPKGTRAFYMMKYELTQGQHAQFLNGIDQYGPDTRANFAGPTYARDHGTIHLVGGRYTAAVPERSANFISWEDGIAFLDWAALRPMTDLEFEKAARGPEPPLKGGYVWGTASTLETLRGNFPLVPADTPSENDLSDETRIALGASHYWVMDLSGSLWERTVTLADSAGRMFTGLHGDGRINAYGDADVEGWPRELGSPRRHKGFGYRGGGYYGPTGAHDFYRPHSPIAWRPFGAWSGGPRHRAYGMRGVRTLHRP